MNTTCVSGNAAVNEIGSKIIPEDQRLNTLPTYFGCFSIIFEQSVYLEMERICPAYIGGYWEFFSLPNGGFYMAPHPLDGQVYIATRNHFAKVVSQDTAGVIATLYALNDLVSRFEDDLLIERYQQLLDWYLTHHPDSAEIYAAIS